MTDVVVALVTAPSSEKAAEIARRTYGSFATAWQVKRDWSTWAGRTGR